MLSRLPLLTKHLSGYTMRAHGVISFNWVDAMSTAAWVVVHPCSSLYFLIDDQR